MAQGEADEDRSPNWRDRVKTVGPWFVALGAIYYVFSRVPFAEAWAEAQSADLPRFLLVIFVAIGIWFLIESKLYSYLLSLIHI